MSRSVEQIMTAAGDLFFREGFRAVGVDTIAAESGVSKMTLYRHFASKDALIAAYLEHSNDAFWHWFDAAAATCQGDGAAQLIAVFDALAELATKPACHGCPFLNAVVDFPEADHPGHAVALAHKQSVLNRLTEMASAAHAGDPTGLAQQLMLLMDGAYMAVRTWGPESPAVTVGMAARRLIVHDIPSCGAQ